MTDVFRGVFPIEVEPLSEADAGDDGEWVWQLACAEFQHLFLLMLSITNLRVLVFMECTAPDLSQTMRIK